MKKSTLYKIIVIVGPTASGKSDLAIKLAQKFRGEIISADSRQVYRGMDIGTGKVTKREQKTVRHHLIDVANPKKQFTADDFKKLGTKALFDITRRTKMPIIVGGTGFYIDILLGRMVIAKVPPNKKLRSKLEKLNAQKLYTKLEKLDPQQAEIIDRHNKRHLIRALEIAEAQNKKVSLKLAYTSFRDTENFENYRTLWLGINPGKERLAQNIKKRLDSRLKQGMIKEVEKLHQRSISWKRLDDFGLEYRQISRYLQNSKLLASPKPAAERRQITNYKQTLNSKSQVPNFKKSGYYEKLLREIIKYSKRQMTWFRKNKEIHWVRDTEQAEKLAKKYLYS